MFGFRSDGYRIKGLDPISKLIPYVMNQRIDAVNSTTIDVRCEKMDEWIAEKREKEKVSFNYMHILVASGIRLYALRPRLNRFVVNKKIYQRNGIYMCLTIKENLSDDSDEVNLKIRFRGNESIYEVKEKLDGEITKAIKNAKENKTTKVASAVCKIPFVLGSAVGLLKFMDRLGILPKSIIEASPFHTSFYVVNLKSIKGGHVHHHIYNFGTTGMFFTIGKEKLEPCVNEDDELEVGKVLKLGITLDERISDGFYYLKSVRMWKEMMYDAHQLEQPLDIEPVESKKERKKRLKKIQKEEKKERKTDTK